MARSLWQSVRGYVKISIKGERCAFFVDCAGDGSITLYSVERVGAQEVRATIRARDFFRLRSAARLSGCSVRIIEKRGLPFALSFFKLRPALLWGGVAVLIALYAASAFLWDISVLGVGNEEVVYEALRSEGIETGMLLSDVRHEGLGDRLVLKLSGAAWAGVTLSGSRMTVTVVEEALPPEFVSEADPCDIVASKDAVIESVYVYAGTAAVSAGDRVKAGEVLVSGTLAPALDGSVRTVHSRAEVVGRVWYTGRAYAAFSAWEYAPTGRTETAVAVRIGTIEGSEESEFSQYDSSRVQSCEITGFFLPLYVFKETRTETAKIVVTRTEEELRQQTADASFSAAVRDIPKDARIIAAATTFSVTESGVEAITVLETTELISKAAPLAEASRDTEE